MAGGRFKLPMEPTAIGLVSIDSNSETDMTAICDAGLIYHMGAVDFTGIYMLCSFKSVLHLNVFECNAVYTFPELWYLIIRNDCIDQIVCKIY